MKIINPLPTLFTSLMHKIVAPKKLLQKNFKAKDTIFMFLLVF